MPGPKNQNNDNAPISPQKSTSKFYKVPIKGTPPTPPNSPTHKEPPTPPKSPTNKEPPTPPNTPRDDKEPPAPPNSPANRG